MKSILDAQRIMLSACRPLPAEVVALDAAFGRALSEDVTATMDAPAFDNSAMDGYAVRAEDVADASDENPVELPIIGESRAGGPMPSPLVEETACRIFTGAPMPGHADAVVIQENTTRQGDQVLIRSASTRGRHVRRRGSDLAQGAVMLSTGTTLLAGEIGLLASQNIVEVSVHRQPKVAILSTGDELRPLGATLELGTIVNSNVHALTALVRQAGATPDAFPIVPDELDALVAALEDALTYDVVLSTGGVSVGDYDVVGDAHDKLGVESRFHKVRIKPGKPFSFGTRGDTMIVGLPGNPISAMVTFEILVAPCLRKMLGDPRPHSESIRATLKTDYRRRPGRVEIARGHVTVEAGQPTVELAPRQGSGSLTSFANINALVLLPAERAEFAAGDEVKVLLTGSGLRSATSPFFDLEINA